MRIAKYISFKTVHTANQTMIINKKYTILLLIAEAFSALMLLFER